MMEAGGLDLAELGDPIGGSRDLDPATVLARLDAVELVEGVLAVLLLPQVSGDRVHGHAEAVPNAVREGPLEILADLAADRGSMGKERVVGRGGAVVVQPQDDAAEVGVVGPGATELVVRGLGSGTAR